MCVCVCVCMHTNECVLQQDRVVFSILKICFFADFTNAVLIKTILQQQQDEHFGFVINRNAEKRFLLF